MKELLNILSMDLLRSIVNHKSLKISQLNSMICLLIKEGVQFSLSFIPATGTEEASAALTIHIRPGIRITLDITFDSGVMFFPVL